MNAISDYLQSRQNNIDPGMLAYVANLSEVASVAPNVARDIVRELAAQRGNLKLIASENYSSLPTQLAMGNLLTDKYAEGFPGHRFYAGCDNVDDIESYAAEQACKLFGAEHAYVQPHSGADANMIAYWAVLDAKVQAPALKELAAAAGKEDINPMDLTDQQWSAIRARLGNQRLLGMHMYSGGHLTHAYRHNVSGKMFEGHNYGVNKETQQLDYDEIEKIAEEVKPLILLAGYSAYPRAINFKRMREIADKVGAVLIVDMAHFAGLVAGGVFEGDFNPVVHADIVTTTTHKTLRGPRGGMILCKQAWAEFVDKGCPLVIGGPLPQMIAAKAVAFTEANKPEFKEYAKKIVENSRALAEACMAHGLSVTTGGTDNHLLVVDVSGFGLTGRQAESALRECMVTLNRNTVPFDTNGPWYTSGIRLGTPAVTTLGMNTEDMKEIANVIAAVLKATKPETIATGDNAGKPSKAKYILDAAVKADAQARIKKLLDAYPVYPNLDLEFLQQHFS